jgi:hypothetical protein
MTAMDSGKPAALETSATKTKSAKAATATKHATASPKRREGDSAAREGGNHEAREGRSHAYEDRLCQHAQHYFIAKHQDVAAERRRRIARSCVTVAAVG